MEQNFTRTLLAIRPSHELPRHEKTGMNTVRCPAWFIAGVASRQGKTTLTAGLARFHRNAGRRVRVFKTGPDFLDPMILERASGAPVHQLDLWMVGETHCRHLLHDAAREADLILVEGAMGLFDGNPSGADLAERFGIPIVAVIDASAMAGTFGAVAYGLRHYRPGLLFAGVVANRVTGDSHRDMLAESLPDGIPLMATLPRDQSVSLPERHLGLVQADEVDALNDRLEEAAFQIPGTALAKLPQPLVFPDEPVDKLPKLLAGVRIGVAHDMAFGFIYRANLDLLTALEAEVIEFSPLENDTLPKVDALWIPGGYPELYLEALGGNIPMVTALRNHHAAGKPLLAECGGMLYLLESLTDKEGQRGRMVGALPGSALMQPHLANIGMHSLELPEGTLRGHTFHHSRMETPMTPVGMSHPQRPHGNPEPLYRQGRLHASYLHLYFSSNPVASATLFSPRIPMEVVKNPRNDPA
uniref:Hydrogenobyrinic acid a,c-diamide synthase (Glutamine-hydrolysing) /cobyrinate a,c-diamide synthase n=1 Tax=Candidatus Kentrum sp. SD TaxID=2126332 RepID=A0A450YSD6_9GAMM|nr:MAG: hydrogenobyrinic acid a,c-diamide synthase (glutamine-hydrolysing) /cobyrinate a,c-diamide synthase [Candidatus Kentron sp. SD]VFK79835.1 MAG: hydrogenobyrinic acid a,c-diamide synthase (glutamine-hydrolysing) /cobyrinate a,c-diamide synthase [Candidatus Kentron sp. SD]